MGNSVTYKGHLLAIYYLEKKGEIEGRVFEFNGTGALKKLLTMPETNKLDEGYSAFEIVDMLNEKNCFGVYFSTEQRILSRCKA